MSAMTRDESRQDDVAEPTDDTELDDDSDDTTWGRAVRVALPLLVLAAAGVVAAALVFSADEPSASAPEAEGILVETRAADRTRVSYQVEGQGEVRAARETDLMPRVSGRVTWVSPELEPGAVVREGTPLFRIDPTDFRLALEQSRAQLAEAKLRLENEAARQDVARAEWETYEEEFGPAEAPDLALREPQRAAAEVGVHSARAQIAQNRVALSRTTVTAPYDAFVDEEAVEIGSLVTPQTRAAHLIGTDHFWVRAAVPLDALPRLELPADGGGDEAVLRLRGEEIDVERRGRVVRLLGRLDDRSRMARVLIRVDDPLHLEQPPDERGLPLLVGSYVDVRIETEGLHEVVRVPSAAVHDGQEVFVFDDGALRIAPVSGARWRGDDVLVREGLEGGERVVVTPLSQPVEGMRLRREDSP